MPLHAPGHKYLGPGTNDLSAKPADSDDAIARAHDLAYRFAESDSDVRNADIDAINQFAAESYRNPHAFLGAVGLGVKFAGESLAGVQYGRKYCIYVFVPAGNELSIY